ncbi:MAG: gephyrin-like molybdotransferase Glp [Candidatus Omnitrophota bacterium]
MLISIKTARDIIFRHTVSRHVLRVRLKEAFKRVLAQDVLAAQDSPDSDKSFMDGYVVRCDDVTRVPTTLKIIEQIRAGKIPRRPLKKGTCAQIATGAMVPKGADAVVIKERTRLSAKTVVEILRRPSAGDHIYRQGQFFKKGERLLRRGTVLNSAAIGLLASQGFSSVKVFGAPRVAILSTGNEITDLGSKKKYGGVWNATAPMLSTLLAGLGIAPRYLGLVPDHPDRMLKKITEGLKYDILIITGAVSVGNFDFVPRVLKDLGAEVLFHKVAIRPGKPLLFGLRGRSLIFGLPGNPVSGWLDFLLFIKPAIHKILGLDIRGKLQEGLLGKTISHEPDRLSFWPAQVTLQGRAFRINPLRYGGSADMGALAKANALVLLKRHQKTFAKNSRIKFLKITE